MFFKTQHKNYGLTALRAKGRMKKGELNRTETSYAQYLEGEKQSGRVADYWFESLKLKVADGTCWYTPDFMVLLPDGRLELHEVKGGICQDTSKKLVRSLFIPEEPQQGLCPYASLPQDIFLT